MIGSRSRWRWLGPRVVGVCLIVAIWQVARWSGLFSPTLLSSPWDSISRLVLLIGSGSVLPDFAVSMWRMFAGYGIACALGTVIGLLVGSLPSLRAVSEFPLDFFRSLPVTTLYPIFVLVFGIGHESKIAMVCAASIFVVTLNTMYGVAHASRVRVEMARLFGAKRRQIFMWITLFDALPQTLIGFRVALSYALIVEIVCEMFMGTQRGLGQRVFEAYNTYAIDDLYALVILVGSLGYALNQVFVLIEKRLVSWTGRS